LPSTRLRCVTGSGMDSSSGGRHGYGLARVSRWPCLALHFLFEHLEGLIDVVVRRNTRNVSNLPLAPDARRSFGGQRILRLSADKRANPVRITRPGALLTPKTLSVKWFNLHSAAGRCGLGSCLFVSPLLDLLNPLELALNLILKLQKHSFYLRDLIL
jgi:hypothetical protein